MLSTFTKHHRSNQVPAPRRARRALLAAGAVGASALALGAGAAPSQAAGGLPYRTTLQSLATGFALDSNFAGNVYGLVPNGGYYQKWYTADAGYGTITLRDAATGRCLDSNTSRQVYTLPCNGGSFQRWEVLFRNYGTVVLRDLATGYVLDGNGSGSIYTMPENGGSYQKWIPTAS